MSGQFIVVYVDNAAEDESKKLMQTFMKDAFANTAKGCKWRTSTGKQAHFMMDVTPGGGSQALQIDLFCVNGSAGGDLIGGDFQSEDGTHRAFSKDKLQGFVVVAKVEDPKDKKFKAFRDHIVTYSAHYRKLKGLDEKSHDFIVGVVNTSEAEFDTKKLEKKLKDQKLTDAAKTFYANSPASFLTKLVDLRK